MRAQSTLLQLNKNVLLGAIEGENKGIDEINKYVLCRGKCNIYS